ncbi:hypothetical protein T459_28735 [Capsicum annuum]|uniref:Uncharacterized protein n=1 Tax=Capsicum annuum TaxID=4072 RepID=A0A2G2YHL4_CAPAN|nr:hypothetical protein T459_28735 [Capsicum annuum]
MGKERISNCMGMFKLIMRKLKSHIQLIPKYSNRHQFDVVDTPRANEEVVPNETEDEYGFEQKGVLEIPCHATELQKILELNIGN